MMPSLRLLVPPASLSLPSRQLQQRLLVQRSLRHATTAPPKPRVLAKPDRFNPPSHPSRLRAKRPSYGAPLSDHERQAQTTRRYPHMMPPEGSFMYWFLTNRYVHLYISLSILLSLTVLVWINDFRYTTPYLDLLPPNSMFFAHPIKFLRRYLEVYNMHLGYVSAQTAAKRKRKVEDVKKRSDYRKAHGIDKEGMFGGWTAREEGEALGPALRAGGVLEQSPVAAPQGTVDMVKRTVKDAGENAGADTDGTYLDSEGKLQPLRKKWFGIW